MVNLKIIYLSLTALFIFGCSGIFSYTYEEDFANDRNILQEIINMNPILDSIPETHRFFETDAEYGRATGGLNFSSLGLNDSNFILPKSVKKFRIVNSIYLFGNEFTELPRGIRNKDWSYISISRNRICNPTSETLKYLDEKTKIGIGGYWRDYQVCGDST